MRMMTMGEKMIWAAAFVQQRSAGGWGMEYAQAAFDAVDIARACARNAKQMDETPTTRMLREMVCDEVEP